MTEILKEDNFQRKRRGFTKRKRHSLKTDMTPFVDLGFLLITFFVFTAQLVKPTTLKLNMPTDGPPSLLGESNALTILLDKNDRVYYYHGTWNEARSKDQVFETNFSVTEGIGKIIRKKQNTLDATSSKEKREGLMLLIKAGEGASYKNLIDALDETLINKVSEYTVMAAGVEEAAWMERKAP